MRGSLAIPTVAKCSALKSRNSLPTSATNTMTTWLMANIAKPYPSERQKRDWYNPSSSTYIGPDRHPDQQLVLKCATTPPQAISVHQTSQGSSQDPLYLWKVINKVIVNEKNVFFD